MEVEEEEEEDKAEQLLLSSKLILLPDKNFRQHNLASSLALGGFSKRITNKREGVRDGEEGRERHEMKLKFNFWLIKRKLLWRQIAKKLRKLCRQRH